MEVIRAMKNLEWSREDPEQEELTSGQRWGEDEQWASRTDQEPEKEMKMYKLKVTFRILGIQGFVSHYFLEQYIIMRAHAQER